MRRLPPSPPLSHGEPSEERGAALVIGLDKVAFLAIPIIGLLHSAQSSRQIASHQCDAVEARIAVDSALEIVIGQIRRATIEGIDTDNGKGAFSWASQPGAMRVFDQAGTEREIHKLYSSAAMIVPGGLRSAQTFPPTGKILLTNFWILMSPFGGEVIGFSQWPAI